MEAHTRNESDDGVEHVREEASRERVAPFRLPARDEVETLVELCEQVRDLRGVVLEVAVDRDDDVAARMSKAGGEGDRLAEVSPQPDDADVVVVGVEAGERGEGAVDRSVVAEQCLPVVVERIECRLELLVEERDAPLLVEHGNDDGDHDGSVLP